MSATGAEDVTNAKGLALTVASKFIFLSSPAQAACVALKPIKVTNPLKQGTDKITTAGLLSGQGCHHSHCCFLMCAKARTSNTQISLLFFLSQHLQAVHESLKGKCFQSLIGNIRSPDRNVGERWGLSRSEGKETKPSIPSVSVLNQDLVAGRRVGVSQLSVVLLSQLLHKAPGMRNTNS